MPERILVVDDEASIRELLAYNLTRAGYEVITASSGEEAISGARQLPDLVILDLMLPGIDGFEVCKLLRRQFPDLPILMLTARSDEIDRVIGFEIGVDDYVTKPFSPREVVGRVKAIIRRAKHAAEPAQNQETLTFGPLSLNFVTYEVTRSGNKIDLTPTEYQLLRMLATQPGRVFSREELLNRVMGPDYYGDVRTIDVHIRHLRSKIEPDAAQPTYIETVRGFGYKFAGAKGS